jgi:phosphatidylinositol alpha-mannosyltransferase
MRVGLVSAYAMDVPGGVQAQVTGLSAHLTGLGHEVSVLAPGPAVAGSVSAGSVVALRANGSLARVGLRPPRLVRLRDWSRELDVVHVHEPLAPGLPHAVLRAAEVPVVATVHAQSTAWLLRLARPWLHRVCSRATLVTAVSRHAAATAALAGVGVDLVVPNGIRLPPDPGPAQREPVVVGVGRLDEPRKGMSVLARAWPEVRAVTGADLRLVGPGRWPGPAAGGTGGIDVLGRVTDDVRDCEIAAGRVLVAPNLGGESFGLVVAEAMAHGTAVVASALPAFVDLLDERDGLAAGLLVPPGDPQALAGALVRVLREPGLAERLGREGRRRAAGLGWHAVGPRYLEAYAAAVGPGPSMRP